MKKFKSGRLFDIFSSSAMHPDGNLRHGSSYYVQVTYLYDGEMRTENAILHFNENCITFGRGCFSLTRADGTSIFLDSLQDPDEGMIDLDNFIKVYDIPENNGNATVDGLRELNKEVEVETAPPPTNGPLTVGVVNDIPMRTILNGTYNKDCPDILYTHNLDTTNSTTFSSFVESSESAASSIMSTINDIEAILSETNSDAFYSGSTAKLKRKKLTTLSNNIGTFKTNLEKLEPTELKNRIDEYNEKFSQTKKLTRLNLLQKKINSINNEKILYEKVTERYDPPITQHSLPDDTFYYEDNKFRVEVSYEYTPSGSQINFNQYKKTTKRYIFLQYSTADSYKKLEELIESVGQHLPYDKSRIVED